jgi:hypothetical protein
MKRVVSTALALAALAGAAEAAAGAGPCTERACEARIAVKGVTDWTSPQRLSGNLDHLAVRSRGMRLAYEPAGKCTAFFYGRGIVVRLRVCGRGKVPLRVRAVTVDGRPATLRISYRVAAG